jgi:hypothetical protein
MTSPTVARVQRGALLLAVALAAVSTAPALAAGVTESQAQRVAKRAASARVARFGISRRHRRAVLGRGHRVRHALAPAAPPRPRLVLRVNGGQRVSSGGRIAVVILAGAVSFLAVACGDRRDACRRAERPPVTRLHHPDRCRPTPTADGPRGSSSGRGIAAKPPSGYWT